MPSEQYEEHLSVTEIWAWCRDCDWVMPRSEVEELVQLRAQEGIDDDTDDVAREHAQTHRSLCTEGGRTEIADVLKTDDKEENHE